MAETENLRPLAPKPQTAAKLMSAVQSGRAQPGEGTRTEDIQFLYLKLLDLQPQMKEGAIEATEDWLDIADALLRDFRSNKAFYPMARSILFMGYSTGAKAKGTKSRSGLMMDEMQEMAGRLQGTETIGKSQQSSARAKLISYKGEIPEEVMHGAIPTDYHGIPFDEWLDIFLMYALVVAEQGEPEEAYETLDSAAVASIWLHSKPKLRMIHVCWFCEYISFADE
jgi:general transcription factor 3C polypeptide 3 (transcription factor C subunit 4)